MTTRHEYAVGGTVDLDVAIESGSVVVEAVERDETVDGAPGVPGSPDVTIDIDGRPDEWVVTRLGSTVSVRLADRRRVRSARIGISVPAGSRVEISSSRADARLDGRFGGVRVKTATGDVVMHTTDAVDVSTASGDVHAGEIGGDAHVSTVSGDARIAAVDGRLVVTTTSGDIEVGRVGGDVDAKSVSGDFRIGRFDGDELTVKTVAGDLDVGLPSGIRVAPEISTFAGQTRLPPPSPPDPPAPPPPPPAGHEATPPPPRRRVGVTVKSVSGDVTIRRVEH